MHVLTKIFVVLVSLLAVFLVPLVVVYAYNENSFKAMYQEAEAQSQVARENLASATAQHSSREARLQSEIDELEQQVRNANRQREQALAETTNLRQELAAARAMQAEIQSRLAVLASGVEAGSELTASLVSDLRTARRDAMVAEQQRVELDEALREVTAQYEVADAARRALQEEVQRLTEEQAQTMEKLSEYVARFGTMADEPRARRITPDRNLTTTIINVRRTDDRVYAEIGAGSRDGVREGWTMTIGRGAEFLGNLEIISVDLNRSTGVVRLEDPRRGLVDVGDVAQAWAGRD